MKVEEGFEGASSIIRRWPTSIWLKKMGRTMYSDCVPSWDNTARRGRRALICLNVRRKTTDIGYQNRLGGRSRNFPGGTLRIHQRLE